MVSPHSFRTFFPWLLFVRFKCVSLCVVYVCVRMRLASALHGDGYMNISLSNVIINTNACVRIRMQSGKEPSPETTDAAGVAYTTRVGCMCACACVCLYGVHACIYLCVCSSIMFHITDGDRVVTRDRRAGFRAY